MVLKKDPAEQTNRELTQRSFYALYVLIVFIMVDTSSDFSTEARD